MPERAHILICAGAACISAGEESFKSALEKELKEAKIYEEVKIIETGCFGTCDLGPVMVIYPEGIFYIRLKPQDARDIVNEHLLKGRVVERLLVREPELKIFLPTINELPFFKNQVRIALRNVGFIDPLNIEEYIAREGYSALGKVLTEMTPEEVIEEVKKSGLRGRGGAGFPTGIKWELGRKAKGDEKYIICNADEGDPGAFMDRSILEGDPHSVIEGMLIGAYAIGAKKGFVYIRAEYPLAIKRLTYALEQAKSYGLLGENILGTNFSFDIEIRIGAGAFVCGEETALIASVEGKRGMPRPRPPFPVNSGLWNKPTVINNVETWANIPEIILKGADWFSSLGTEKSKGTKVFALAGKINMTGLIEVPMGITLREIVYDIGGGIPEGRKFKAVQIGGPAGGCIPAEYLDTPVDYESITSLGAIMGSGGLIVMDEDNCMVDVAKFFLSFTQDESCGKCVPCRVGTKRMLEILDKITKGDGEIRDLEELEDLANVIKNTSLCGLGKGAPNPVLTTLKYFRDEYIAHIKDKKCPAKSCIALIHYEVIREKCRKCSICFKNCPVGAIFKDYDGTYVINQEKCTKCGICFQICPFKVIKKE
ncbi:MAG: NADH-quinone oxidoreductase subunit NuoF [Dictyoglomus sp.]|nr:NADH-quinone oxidoreductase subunit NuoF [Dictyoglomus sp.]MCX7941555.1 NADH-quinone oxidoreductase subunit NuoF [Dictyoglomaceae bacterium]MDW8187825.1 NADH-quinone oxidoreductase subunit NuoF [Dictyoglomus sp.]